MKVLFGVPVRAGIPDWAEHVRWDGRGEIARQPRRSVRVELSHRVDVTWILDHIRGVTRAFEFVLGILGMPFDEGGNPRPVFRCDMVRPVPTDLLFLGSG